MLTPYYEDEAVTLYHGDCREILPNYPAPALVIADPPYGIGHQVKASTRSLNGKAIRMGGWDKIAGDDQAFDPSHLLRYPRLVLFGANYYSDRLPVSGGWIVWDKSGRGKGPKNSFVDVELAWTNLSDRPSIFHHLWKGLSRDSENGRAVMHPTQKPVDLMRWIILWWSKPGDLILDPYTGSGTTLVAAKAEGRRSVGMELEERYCEVAAERCRNTPIPDGMRPGLHY